MLDVYLPPELPQVESRQVLELVVFRSSAPEKLVAARRIAFAKVAGLDGFVRSYGYQSAQHPDLFLDAVVWESLDAAHAAAKAAETSQDFAAYFGLIDTVTVMAHFADVKTKQFSDGSAEVMEVALFQVGSGYDAAKASFLDALGDTPIRQLTWGGATGGKELRMDLALWPDVDVAKSAERAMMADERVQAAFAALAGPPLVLDFFKLYEVTE